MDRNYSKPPLVEALCEFHFARDVSWDIVMPGLIYQKVKDQFPDRKPFRRFDAKFTPKREGVTQEIVSEELVRLSNAGDKVLFTIGPYLCSMNHLAPYSSWEIFSDLIKRGFEAYIETVKPTGFSNIILRYINNIELSDSDSALEDSFNLRPYVGDSTLRQFEAFKTGIQISFEKQRDLLQMELSSVKSEEGNHAAMLDLTYSLMAADQVNVDTVFEWVENAHTQIKKSFEACIKDTLREKFEPRGEKE